MKTKEKSLRDVIDEILKLKTPAEGKKYIRAELRKLRRGRVKWKKMPYKKAKNIFLSNVGYMSGYYSARTANKIMRTVGASHPIFGGPR